MSDSMPPPRVISNRVLQIQDPVIPIVRRMIEGTPGTLSLGQGTVHYSPPQPVLQVLANAQHTSSDRIHSYGFVAGQTELLGRLTEKLERDNGIQSSGDTQVVFTAGSNLAFLHTILAIADPGDEIILPRPFFFNQEMAIQLAGCKPVYVDCLDNYQLNIDAIRENITSKTRAIVTVSPNNPTGVVYPKQDLITVSQLCAAQNIYHISDEAYEYFCFAEPHFSPGSRREAADYTISLFTFSKSHALAGWRAGYMHLPHHLKDSIHKIQDTSLVCPTQLTEQIALAALKEDADWCRRQANHLKATRDAVLHLLRPLEPWCEIPDPEGAFYMLLKIDSELPSMTLVERLIREHKVALLPGDTFGLTNCCSMRLSYASQDAETILEAVRRLAHGLQQILQR